MNIKLDIKNNKFGLELNEILGVAKRDNNPKRNFLFVTNLLGKCLIANPDVCRGTGYLMADLVMQTNSFDEDILVNSIRTNKSSLKLKKELEKSIDTDENVFVMGFAETATGLGMSVASAIKNSYYVTTSREEIKDVKSIFDFEEEHSHATTHKCYLKDLDKLRNADRVILVDDEITTGKTCLNLIRELRKITKANKFSVLTIFDWRNDEYYDLYDEFRKETGLDITTYSIIAGNLSNITKDIFKENDNFNRFEIINIKEMNEFNHSNHLTMNGNIKYIDKCGLFGVSYKEIRDIESKCKKIASDILKRENGKKIAILGHGENIYIPSRVASYLSNDVNFQTTTRSPLITENIENYPIKDRIKFIKDDVTYYLYNTKEMENNFDKTIMLTDKDIKFKLLNNIEIYKI